MMKYTQIAIQKLGKSSTGNMRTNLMVYVNAKVNARNNVLEDADSSTAACHEGEL